jgi:NAD(P)-dependent dehydrogenase (short-subunit alcohol dehydrogenase family)
VDLRDEGSVNDALLEVVSVHPKLTTLVFTQRCTSDASNHEHMQVNVHAMVQIVEGLKDLMTGSDPGCVVVVSSLASRLVSTSQGVGYHLAKAAQVQAMRYLAWTLGKEGIHVNALCPSYFVREGQGAPPPSLDCLARLGALPGPNRSAYILRWIDFLADAQCKGVTGQAIDIDCGAGLVDPESRCLQYASQLMKG